MKKLMLFAVLLGGCYVSGSGRVHTGVVVSEPVATVDLNGALAASGLVGNVSARRGLAHPRAIVITNNDLAGDLEIYSGVSSATVRLATVFHLQAWYLETNADIWIKNETAAPIACRVCEVFYPV